MPSLTSRRANSMANSDNRYSSKAFGRQNRLLLRTALSIKNQNESAISSGNFMPALVLNHQLSIL